MDNADCIVSHTHTYIHTLVITSFLGTVNTDNNTSPIHTKVNTYRISGTVNIVTYGNGKVEYTVSPDFNNATQEYNTKAYIFEIVVDSGTLSFGRMILNSR